MNFDWPIKPPPTSTPGQKFGAARGTKKHTGLDMGTAGQTVLAPAAGKVRYAAETGDSRGTAIYLTHAEENGVKWETRFFHLAKLLIKRGDQVLVGTPIGIVGMTGLPKPWPHLHFEVRKDGVPVDPELYLVAPGTSSTTIALAAGALMLFFTLWG